MNQMIDTLSPGDDASGTCTTTTWPPWANGETGRVGSPKRREIGHGALAARAVLPVVPSQEDFAYTLRLVSEVHVVERLDLDGVGLLVVAVADGRRCADPRGRRRHRHGPREARHDQYVTLTDILGAEDAFGDMDFKVAGTADAITALQLDTKIDGIPADVLTAALAQAKVARLQILEVMNAAIPKPRDDGRRDGAEDHHDLHPDGQDR